MRPRVPDHASPSPRINVSLLALGPLVAAMIIVFGSAVGVAGLGLQQCAASTAAGQINVKQYGARGNGSANDTAAFIKAMSAAVLESLQLYVPTGNYRVDTLTLPDGLIMRGAGSKASWIRGGVVFGSNGRIRGLKLGRAGYSMRNGANASNTRFTACRFRGGGGALPGVNSCVVQLGNAWSCDHITFRDCLFERSFGIEDSDYSTCFNDIGLVENGASAEGAHLDSITFDGCHIGVSNGRTDIPRNIGSPRMGLECFTWDGGDGIASHGWSNIGVIDCVFEGADMCTLDLADSVDSSGQHVSGPAIIHGCTLKGGGYDGRYWGYAICCEAPRDVVIENNIFYRAHDITLAVSWSRGVNTSGYVIRNNVFALDVNNGITPGPYSMVLLRGRDHTFTGNTITTNRGSTVLELQGFSNGIVTGNTLNELRSRNAPSALQIYNVTGTTVTGNTFRTAASTDPVIYHAGTNTNNTISDNVFLHK